jgi:hypothetical protein
MSKIDQLTLALRTSALASKKAKALAYARRMAGEPFTDEQRRAYRAALIAAADIELDPFVIVPVPEGCTLPDDAPASKEGGGTDGEPG